MSPETLGVLLGIAGGVVTWYGWRYYDKRTRNKRDEDQS